MRGAARGGDRVALVSDDGPGHEAELDGDAYRLVGEAVGTAEAVVEQPPVRFWPADLMAPR